jgi:hypothetical protein
MVWNEPDEMRRPDRRCDRPRRRSLNLRSRVLGLQLRHRAARIAQDEVGLEVRKVTQHLQEANAVDGPRRPRYPYDDALHEPILLSPLGILQGMRPPSAAIPLSNALWPAPRRRPTSGAAVTDRGPPRAPSNHISAAAERRCDLCTLASGAGRTPDTLAGNLVKSTGARHEAEKPPQARRRVLLPTASQTKTRLSSADHCEGVTCKKSCPATKP